ncbi:MAG: transcriptional regulator [marine bacterium B5-7]|nr:MAG: transcriptional regulator [marine bacterium B5-7]
MAKLKNIHPGEILFEEFIKPLGVSQNKLANDMGVPPRRINEIVHGLRAVTADTDLRLSRALGTSEGFWLGLQMDFDLEAKKAEIRSQLRTINNLISGDDCVGA